MFECRRLFDRADVVRVLLRRPRPAQTLLLLEHLADEVLLQVLGGRLQLVIVALWFLGAGLVGRLGQPFLQGVWRSICECDGGAFELGMASRTRD